MTTTQQLLLLHITTNNDLLSIFQEIWTAGIRDGSVHAAATKTAHVGGVDNGALVGDLSLEMHDRPSYQRQIKSLMDNGVRGELLVHAAAGFVGSSKTDLHRFLVFRCRGSIETQKK